MREEEAEESAELGAKWRILLLFGKRKPRLKGSFAATRLLPFTWIIIRLLFLLLNCW